METPRIPSMPTIWPSRITIVAGMMLLQSSTTPAVAATGPLVLRVTCVPVAKMSSAMRGSALCWKRAVVNEPISRKPRA